MDGDLRLFRNELAYDVILSILYAWSVFQAYLYDAKTQTGGVTIYIVVYGGFTLLSRSPLGVLMMNGLSALTLPTLFATPPLNQVAGYFSFQPLLGIGVTVLIALFQAALSVPLVGFGRRFLAMRHQYLWSAMAAIVFTAGLTTFVSTAPH